MSEEKKTGGNIMKIVGAAATLILTIIEVIVESKDKEEK
jgi:hypothetical protein